MKVVMKGWSIRRAFHTGIAEFIIHTVVKNYCLGRGFIREVSHKI